MLEEKVLVVEDKCDICRWWRQGERWVEKIVEFKSSYIPEHQWYDRLPIFKTPEVLPRNQTNTQQKWSPKFLSSLHSFASIPNLSSSVFLPLYRAATTATIAPTNPPIPAITTGAAALLLTAAGAELEPEFAAPDAADDADEATDAFEEFEVGALVVAGLELDPLDADPLLFVTTTVELADVEVVVTVVLTADVGSELTGVVIAEADVMEW